MGVSDPAKPLASSCFQLDLQANCVRLLLHTATIHAGLISLTLCAGCTCVVMCCAVLLYCTAGVSVDGGSAAKALVVVRGHLPVLVSLSDKVARCSP